MNASWLRPTSVLRGRIEDLHHGKDCVSFEMEGHRVEFPERGAASPVQDGHVVTLVVRRKFWPSSENLALAFAEQSEGKARPVGRGIHLFCVVFGLPFIAGVTALVIIHGASSYRGGDGMGTWWAMVTGGMFVAYSAYRVVEVTRAVKLLRELLQTSPAQTKAGAS